MIDYISRSHHILSKISGRGRTGSHPKCFDAALSVRAFTPRVLSAPVKFLPWFGLLRCRCCSHKSRYVLFCWSCSVGCVHYDTFLLRYCLQFTRFQYLHLHTSVVLLLTGVSIHTSIFYLRRIAHTVLRRDSRHQHFFSFLRIGFISYPSNSPPLGVRAAPIPCLRTSSSDMPRSLYVLN